MTTKETPRSTATRDEPILSPSITKSLCDKDKMKRRAGGKELERVLKKHLRGNKRDEIQKIIEYFGFDLCESLSINLRQGGLWGLATCSIVLFGFVRDPQFPEYLYIIIRPILKCFGDKSKLVRFSAIESCYNVAKSVRKPILKLFPEIFHSLCQLSGDGSPLVRNGTQLLSQLMKDVVLENADFDIPQFVGLIKDHLYSTSSYLRQFLLSWVTTVHSSPNFQLIPHLPNLLDGLYVALADEKKEIMLQTENILNEFIHEMLESPNDPTPDYDKIIPIIVHNVQQTEHVQVRRIGQNWLRFLLKHAPEEDIRRYLTPMFAIVFNNISHRSQTLREGARAISMALMDIVKRAPPMNFSPFFPIILSQLRVYTKPSRIEALTWVRLLYKKDARKVLNYREDVLMNSKARETQQVGTGLFSTLVQVLKDPDPGIVSQAMEVIAMMGTTEVNFKNFMASLVSTLATDDELFVRTSEVVRKLSHVLQPVQIYMAISAILSDPQFYHTRLEFCHEFVRILNLILLTSKEYLPVRNIVETSKSSRKQLEVFFQLYKCWCHNPIAALSLCLLSGHYDLSCELVTKKYLELEVSVKLLLEIDNLVQLIESPIFSKLRLRLLRPKEFPGLVRTLYGLLMLLPQSSAYSKLKERLMSVSTMILLDGQSNISPPSIEQDDEGEEGEGEVDEDSESEEEEGEGKRVEEVINDAVMLKYFSDMKLKHFQNVI